MHSQSAAPPDHHRPGWPARLTDNDGTEGQGRCSWTGNVRDACDWKSPKNEKSLAAGASGGESVAGRVFVIGLLRKVRVPPHPQRASGPPERGRRWRRDDGAWERLLRRIGSSQKLRSGL